MMSNSSSSNDDDDLEEESERYPPIPTSSRMNDVMAAFPRYQAHHYQPQPSVSHTTTAVNTTMGLSPSWQQQHQQQQQHQLPQPLQYYPPEQQQQHNMIMLEQQLFLARQQQQQMMTQQHNLAMLSSASATLLSNAAVGPALGHGSDHQSEEDDDDEDSEDELNRIGKNDNGQVEASSARPTEANGSHYNNNKPNTMISSLNHHRPSPHENGPTREQKLLLPSNDSDGGGLVNNHDNYEDDETSRMDDDDDNKNSNPNDAATMDTTQNTTRINETSRDDAAEEDDNNDGEPEDEDLSLNENEEEEDISQREEDDLAEQEEEDTLSRQGVDDARKEGEDNEIDDDDENDDDDNEIDDQEQEKEGTERLDDDQASPRKMDEEEDGENDDSSGNDVQNESKPSLKRKAEQLSPENAPPKEPISKPKSRRRKGRGYQRMLSDSIYMYIPLEFTADLGIAIKRTRENRVASLYVHFPELKPPELKDADNNNNNNNVGDEAVDEEEGEDPLSPPGKDAASPKPRGKKRPKLKHVPRPNQFSSMIDYLEAKYVQGVMVADDDDEEDDQEGGGSVYSETSFLDDSGLQRTVAEFVHVFVSSTPSSIASVVSFHRQVMGHATTTKLELEDDDAFFVNVGDLEVEESDMTKTNYDPLNDIKAEAKTKRKKAATAASKSTKDGKNGASPKKGSTAKAVKALEKPESSKAKKEKAIAKPKSESSVPKAKPVPAKAKSESTVDLSNPVILRLKNAEERARKLRDELYDEIVLEIKSWDEKVLPKKEVKSSKVRVAIVVPQGKKSGDTISFVNPHKPDQRLRTTIPVGVEPLGKFHVQIPAPEEPEEASSSTDFNKIPRESYDKFDDYARAYDEWADAEGAYRKAIKDKDYSAHKQKRNKFDELVMEFPKDLKTPIDKAYMQRVIRRARQNRHKKAQIVAKKQQEETSDGPETGDRQTATRGEDKENDSESEDNSEKEQGPVNNWESYVPKRGRLFSTVRFDSKDFEHR